MIPMTRNKEIAWSYFELLNDHRIEDALQVLHDEGSFWSLRTRLSTPTPQQKDYIRAVLDDAPMQFTLHNAIEDGDQIALEMSSHAEMADGFVYEQLYCFVISIRDGKIFELREYLDTRLAQELIERCAEASQIRDQLDATVAHR